MGGEILVPPLGESVTEATVAKWYKKPGDSVKSDELLVELETDKVTLEVNAPANGMLKEIKQQTGTSVKVGAVLGMIEMGAKGVQYAANANAEIRQEMPQPKIIASPQAVPPLSPAVRKIVAENQVDTSSMQGSGKSGRITKGDVLTALETPRTQTAKANNIREERVKMSKLRSVIAKRLKESQNTAAMLTTFNEIDMGHVMQLRNEYKDSFEKKHGVKLGFMSFFVKAAINALREIPSVNAEIDGEEIVYKNYYDIGVAVGTPSGLVVPVVRDADTLSFAEVEKTINSLGVKARDGKLTMTELTGGTFTISNGGIYGSLMSTPIINPPQSAILGMHKIQERPVVIAGKIEIRPMMYIALTYDHRLIDGREAVTFLVRVKEAIEDPRRLLLDL